MPPFWKSLKFWEALVFVVAALVLYFKPDSTITYEVILGLILALLRFVGVVPELKAKGLM